MCRSSSQKVTYDFVITSLTEPSMSCLSCLNSLGDGRQVDVQLLFCWVLLPEFVQNSTQHFCIVPIKVFPQISLSSCRAASMDFPDYPPPSLSLSLSLSLLRAIPLYHPWLPISLLDYIQYLYRVVVDKFKLVVQHLPIRVKGFVGERRLWFRSYFSSSVPHVLFGWF